MINKEIIIFMIRQDMIHNRLIKGFENLGLQVDSEHSLEIMSKIAELMGVENGIDKENWDNMFLAFRDMVYVSSQADNDDREQKLNELCNKCYEQLILIAKKNFI